MSARTPTRLAWTRHGHVPGPGRYEAEHDGRVYLITGESHTVDSKEYRRVTYVLKDDPNPALPPMPMRRTYSLTVHELTGLLAGGSDEDAQSWTHGPFPSVAAAKREAEEFASAWVPVSGVPDGVRFVDPQGVPLA